MGLQMPITELKLATTGILVLMAQTASSSPFDMEKYGALGTVVAVLLYLMYKMEKRNGELQTALLAEANARTQIATQAQENTTKLSEVIAANNEAIASLSGAVDRMNDETRRLSDLMMSKPCIATKKDTP